MLSGIQGTHMFEPSYPFVIGIVIALLVLVAFGLIERLVQRALRRHMSGAQQRRQDRAARLRQQDMRGILDGGGCARRLR